ncbi:helix-turn-helix domain-containing protein [Pedobacter lithocola]|uniref:Helix-turn-helix domain-containing protein n=1 Tax=Pedobacter lithocola TaxID=1908239 RepID=A0ABV8P6H3_9SPHI|nr:helix-turn-helix domain-containing protein [Pedobacter petrophilus]
MITTLNRVIFDTMVFTNESSELLSVLELNNNNKNIFFDPQLTDKTILWNTGECLTITIDHINYQVLKNEVLFLTEFHKIDHAEIHSARMVRFNKSFFCMIDQDSQVGSKGLLFYGPNHIQKVLLDQASVQNFEILWKTFRAEMLEKNVLQKEMLESILKRMLILSVRIIRNTTFLNSVQTAQVDLMREFNYLVEIHFLEHHDVAFYASMLNKSPKTLSNLFSSVFNRSPVTIIHDRIMIHARRQINYTNLSIKEIAHKLGYQDIQTFSRFFKNRQGISPAQYRKRLKIIVT